MKAHVKRAIETLEALGFENRASDYLRQQRKRMYLHPFYPDEAPIRLWDGASEAACHAATAMAYKITELVQSAPKAATTLKERYRAQKEREAREEWERDVAALRRVAAKQSSMSKQEIEAARMRQMSTAERQRANREYSNEKFYRSLMRPGFGR